jgi:hypothetical protein
VPLSLAGGTGPVTADKLLIFILILDGPSLSLAAVVCRAAANLASRNTPDFVDCKILGQGADKSAAGKR